MSLKGLGLRRLLSNTAKTTARQLWAGGLQLLAIAVIARTYGPQGNGLYSVALLLPTLGSTMLGLGVAPANTYYLGAKAHGIHAVYRSTLVLWAIISLLGMAAGSWLIVSHGQALFPGVPAVTLWIALSALPCLLFVTYAGSIFQGIQDFSAFNISLSLQPAAVLAGTVLCAILGLDAQYLIAVYVLGSFVAALTLWTMLRRRTAIEPRRYGDIYPYRVALNYGMKSHLGRIVSFLNYRIDLFLVNFLVGPLAAGIYAVAIQLAEKLWLVSQGVSLVLLPRLSEVGPKSGASVSITAIVSRAIFLITFLGAIAAVILAPFLIQVIFGADFKSAYLPFVVMLPGIVAGSVVRILSSEIAARGRPEINLYMALVVVAINAGLNVVLIPRFGILGAATATSIAYTANLIVRLYTFKAFAGVPISDLLIVKRSEISAFLQLFVSLMSRSRVQR